MIELPFPHSAVESIAVTSDLWNGNRPDMCLPYREYLEGCNRISRINPPSMRLQALYAQVVAFDANLLLVLSEAFYWTADSMTLSIHYSV